MTKNIMTEVETYDIPELSALPKEVKEEVVNTLGAYDECTVYFMDGEYKVMTSVFLLAQYPEDFKIIGDFKKDEVLTKDGKILSYFRNFHSYPIGYGYEGKFDWSMVNKVSEAGYGDREIKVNLVDGNIEIAEEQ